MNRIETKFNELTNQNKKALIPYITAGDPEPKVTVSLMHALVKAGADLIELGVPFSEPMADGPVIEAAHARALSHQVTLTNVLAMCAEFRQQDNDTPIVLMGYLNPFENMSYNTFAKVAHNAGVDGVLVVDLPPDDAHDWLTELSVQKIDPIFLIAPTTEPARIKLICEKAKGYLYYVSVKGVTGANTLDIHSIDDALQNIRKHTSLPLAVGFGINSPQAAASVALVADAVIVGSALVAKIAEFKDNVGQINKAVTAELSAMRVAMDTTTSY